MLQPGSSPIDWCESNYIYTPYIAEFVNTFSNILFFALPPVLIYLFRPYGEKFNKGVHIIWVLLMIVGMCSVYFHATLSLLGQLLDELAILWVVAVAFGLWFPIRFLPKSFGNDRQIFQGIIFFLAIISSGLAFIWPAINAVALMTLGIPALFLMISELNKCRNHRVLRLGIRCGAIFILAVSCWINDKLFCDTWTTLNFPYLHAFWHVLIFIAAYTSCVLFAYFDAFNEVPEQHPEIKYWPIDSIEILGIPFVEMDMFKKKHLI